MSNLQIFRAVHLVQIKTALEDAGFSWSQFKVESRKANGPFSNPYDEIIKRTRSEKNYP